MRLRSLILKEFRQYRRDKRMLAMTIVAPILQLTLLGYAANLDVEDLPIIICDQDLTAESRRLVAEIENSGYFLTKAQTVRSDDLMPALDRGDAQIAVHIPRGFGEDLRENGAAVQVIVDGTDSNSAGIGTGYLGGIIVRHGARVLERRMESVATPVKLSTIETRSRTFYNPTLESVYYMVPGVLGLVILVITSNLTALSIVRERETGTLEQVMVTPIRAWELMVGKLVPYALVASADVCIVLAVVLFWFKVPLRGSFTLLLFSAVLFLLTCLGKGLLASTVSRTQQQAQMTMFFLIMPAAILSGFMYPIENMPEWLQPVTLAIPLTHFLEIIRAIMLKGSGVAELWGEILALAVFAVGLIGAGALSFRKRLG